VPEENYYQEDDNGNVIKVEQCGDEGNRIAARLAFEKY